ncbi:MAG: hypothetical protein R3B90_16955 [Planctomycetaceae bacterium]
MKRETLIWLVVLGLATIWLVVRASSGQMALQYVQPQAIGETGATHNDFTAGTAVYSPSRTAGVWVAALLTLFIMSFLYKDNPLYKLAEAVIVGVSAAYWMVVSFWTVLVPNLFGKLWPDAIHDWAMPGLSPVRDKDWYWYLVPLFLGGMLLWRLSPKGGWIARWPLAFIIGTTAGLRLVHFLQADFLSQIQAGVEPVLVLDGSVSDNFWASFRASLVFLATLAALTYFFFSIEHKGIVGRVSRVGIWVLMITFGAAFGYTVMGRIALLAIRFEFLFDNWLWLIDQGQTRLTV